MKTTLFNEHLPISKGFTLPIEQLSFQTIDGELFLSFGFNYKPDKSTQKLLGLKPTLDERPCCGWFMYRATKNIAQMHKT